MAAVFRITGTLLMVMGILAGTTFVHADDDFPYNLEDGREAAVLGGTAVLFGLGFWADQAYEPLTPDEIAALEPESINWFDRSATRRWSPGAAKASDVMLYATMAAPFSLVLSDQGSREPGTLGLMYIETYALQGGLTYLAKNLFARTRPYVYSDNPDITLARKMKKTSRRSFYSGHTSSAFASMVFLASVFDRLYPDSGARGWVWGGCLTAAATTGYLRYAAGRHYPTDILVGAAMGAFVGYLVPSMHEIESEGPGEAKSRKSVTIGFSLGI